MKYELTLTLRPQWYMLTAAEQHKKAKEILLDIFYPNGFMKYSVSCIAELTNEHNVHYHCLIELKDLEDKDKLLNKFRRNSKFFGRKSCSQVQYEDSYKSYMIKSIEDTRKIIGDPIVCDSYGVASIRF